MTERLPLSYKQIKDILNVLQRVHAKMGTICKAAGVAMGETKVGLLLDTLAQRQQQSAEFIDASQNSAEDKVLETWIQFVPIERVEQLLHEMQANAIRAEDLPEYVLKTQQEIAELIPTVQDEPASERVKEFLQSLADREYAEAKHSSGAMLGLDDV